MLSVFILSYTFYAFFRKIGAQKIVRQFSLDENTFKKRCFPRDFYVKTPFFCQLK